MGPKRSPFHYLTILCLLERPLTLHPGGLPWQGQRWEFGKRRVGLLSRVPQGRCREKRHERSVGDDEEGPESGTTGGEKALDPLSGRGASPPPALLCFSFPATQTARVAPGRGHRDAVGGSRGSRLPMLRSLGTHFLAAPGPSRLSMRPSPDLAFRIAPFSLALRPPFFFPGHFSPPSSPSQRCLPASASGLRPSTPSSPWPSPRENEAILAPYASVKSSRLGFRRIRASPSEMRREKGFQGLALSGFLGLRQRLRSVSPSIPEPGTRGTSAQKRPLAGNGFSGLVFQLSRPPSSLFSSLFYLKGPS